LITLLKRLVHIRPGDREGPRCPQDKEGRGRVPFDLLRLFKVA